MPWLAHHEAVYQHAFFKLNTFVDDFGNLLHRLFDLSGRFVGDIEVSAVQVLLVQARILHRDQVDHDVDLVLLQQFQFFCSGVICLAHLR